MVLVSALFGLIAAFSGFAAVVARFKVEPFHSFFVRLSPGLRRLQDARDAVAERRNVKIGDEQETLETLHEVAVKEYDNISERYTPVEFSWFHQGFRFRYAEQREEGKKNSPDVQDELLEFFDTRIAERIGRVAAIFSIVAIAGFFLLLVTSLS